MSGTSFIHFILFAGIERIRAYSYKDILYYI